MNSQSVMLLLAAGSARRFGKDKRRVVPADGSSLLKLSLDCYRATGMSLYVCLSSRPEDDDLEALVLSSGAHCIRCSRSENGMGSTLAEGVRGVRGKARMGAERHKPAIAIALADMPAVRACTLRSLESAACPDRIVFPVYQSRRGHPVFFGSQFVSLLEGLSGDKGAGSVLCDYQAACRAVDVDDPGVIQDADTPAAMQLLSELLPEPGRETPSE